MYHTVLNSTLVQVISYGQKLSRDVTRLVEQMHAVPDSLINFY